MNATLATEDTYLSEYEYIFREEEDVYLIEQSSTVFKGDYIIRAFKPNIGFEKRYIAVGNLIFSLSGTFTIDKKYFTLHSVNETLTFRNGTVEEQKMRFNMFSLYSPFVENTSGEIISRRNAWFLSKGGATVGHRDNIYPSEYYIEKSSYPVSLYFSNNAYIKVPYNGMYLYFFSLN